MAPNPGKRWILILGLVALLLCAGCSAVPLPAIDPTGEHVFLPSPSYTTVSSPFDSSPRWSCIPRPAFPEPPPIPACAGPPPAFPAPIVGTGVAAPTPVERLILTPAKVVAPINSEVILVAGVCGNEGYLITKRPIEWMMSPDSVGNFIGLSEGGHPTLAKLAGHGPQKECNNLAITHTSHAPQLVTRGTAQPQDDLLVRKGQTWISVSSPTEGVSHVTAVAKETENWETRRQTATIYWVDMQWAFPSPQIVRAGQPSILSTAVSRTSTGSPATNALVRYEITGGTPASFFGSGRTAQEVPTDANGRADVQVVQDVAGPGSTQVRVQILSGGISGDGGSRAVIGEGFTTITWSAPGLAVALSGPQVVSRNGVATYHIEVSNPGDIATRNALLKLDLPTSFKYLNSRPSARPMTNRLEWQLGNLEPRQTVAVDVTCQVSNSGEWQLIARVTSPDAPEARAAHATRVVESALTIQFVDPPTTAAVGGQVEFNFEVTNTSDIPVQNVVVRDIYDAGFEPGYAGYDASRPLEMRLGSLAAGETQRRGVALIARKPGQQCHTLEVTADGGHTASARTCVDVAQPVLSVDVRKAGPPQARVGESVRFVIEVTNTGEAPLTNVRVADRPDALFRVTEGSQGLRREGDEVVGTIGVLGVSQRIVFEIICECRAEAARAINQVVVTADNGVRETAQTEVAILAAPAPPRTVEPSREPVTPTTPAPPAVTDGKLGLEFAHLGDPSVNGVVTFILRISNQSPTADQDTLLTVTLPPEFTDYRTSQESLKTAVTSATGRITIGPIREIRGNEQLGTIRIQATARKAGRYKVKVRAESRRTQPIEAETEVNVIPN